MQNKINDFLYSLLTSPFIKIKKTFYSENIINKTTSKSRNKTKALEQDCIASILL